MDISVIIPVTRRAEALESVLDEVRAGLALTKKSYEVILAVDGESPRQLEAARTLARDDESIRVLHFARSFGEGAALRAGLLAAGADLLLTFPAYFQVKIDVLPKLLEAVEDGADIAFASRLPHTGSAFNRLQRWCFNALVRKLLGFQYRDVACGVRVIRRRTLEDIAVHGAFHRYITPVAILNGHVAKEVDAALHPEAKRTRAYGPLTYLKRFLGIANVFFLSKFMHKPLRFFGVAGSLLLLPGILICAYVSVQKIVYAEGLGDRPLFLLGVVMTVLGFQILAIGLLGEIISFSHAARHQSFAIREVVRKKVRKKRAKASKKS